MKKEQKRKTITIRVHSDELKLSTINRVAIKANFIALQRKCFFFPHRGLSLFNTIRKAESISIVFIFNWTGIFCHKSFDDNFTTTKQLLLFIHIIYSNTFEPFGLYVCVCANPNT